MFGGQNTATSSLWGTPSTTQAPSSFGQAQTTTGSLFNANQPQNITTPGSIFGAKPAGSSFGGNTQPQTSGLFGGQQQTGSLFGGQQQTQQVNTFGQQPQQTGSLFGGQPAQQQTASLFGGQPAQQQISSLFGGQQQTGSLFGGQQPAQQPGLLFGGNQPQITGSLFGNTAQNGGNLFGGNTGGALFGGANTQAQGVGMLGSNPQQQYLGNQQCGIFGTVPGLYGNQNQSPYSSNLNILSSLPLQSSILAN